MNSLYKIDSTWCLYHGLMVKVKTSHDTRPWRNFDAFVLKKQLLSRIAPLNLKTYSYLHTMDKGVLVEKPIFGEAACLKTTVVLTTTHTHIHYNPIQRINTLLARSSTLCIFVLARVVFSSLGFQLLI